MEDRDRWMADCAIELRDWELGIEGLRDWRLPQSLNPPIQATQLSHWQSSHPDPQSSILNSTQTSGTVVPTPALTPRCIAMGRLGRRAARW